jgi:hypothetical protein
MSKLETVVSNLPSKSGLESSEMTSSAGREMMEKWTNECDLTDENHSEPKIKQSHCLAQIM